MQFLFDNIGWIIFIGFIVMSAVFNSAGAILKKAAQAAENSKDYQKSPQKYNPMGGESAEDFFARMQSTESKPQKKRRLSPQLQEIETNPTPEDLEEVPYEFKAPDRDNLESIPKITKKTNKAIHRVDAKDKKTLRKAIIINEVLGRPKAFKH